MSKAGKLAVVAFCAVAQMHAAEPIDIAVRGESASYTIVIPEKASAVETYAAEELQSFLEKVTGVKLPVATDDKTMPERAILLGETKYSLGMLCDGSGTPVTAGEFDAKTLGSDGFRLAARPPHLVAYGSSKRGALYAAYEILETYAGCRWYASWHSVIPKKDRVASASWSMRARASSRRVARTARPGSSAFQMQTRSFARRSKRRGRRASWNARRTTPSSVSASSLTSRRASSA